MKTGVLTPGNSPKSAAQQLAAYAGTLLLVAVATVLGLLIEAKWGTSPVGMLYLLPVLAAAIFAGLGPGLVAAVASTLVYNYYFTAPYHTFRVHSPADLVTVIMLFLVAAVCSQLASSVRRQAQLASGHARRNATIAGFSRRLLSVRGETEAADVGATQIADLFGCHVAILIDRGDIQTIASVPQISRLSPADLAAASFTLQSGERSGRGEKRGPQADWQFHPVTSEDAVLAAVGLARDDGAPPITEDRRLLFESLLDQLALALERARLEAEAHETAALRARDKLRSALLTSIGDDIKPRLKALQVVARTLRRDGQSDRALVSEIERDLSGIERHIDNLVDVAPGEQSEAISLGDVTVDLHSRTVTRYGEVVHLTPKEFALLAELTKHAGRVLTHAQLLRAIWGPSHQDHVDYLRVAIRALRQKLEIDPGKPRLIVNEPSVGYRLVV